ncbi:MAG: tRNA pseudouridine(38-40) synthase TruA [Parachlamydiales bacterium]|jgi:tRNA pseudouridine38-40 synthase
MNDPEKYTYKMVLAYDGTPFGGWQIQPQITSIQQLVNEALTTILRQPAYVVGSGRTDAGVHALAQTAHFHTSKPIPLFKVLGSLNGLLPPQIRIKEIVPVSNDFHARYSATKKIYRYHLTLNPLANPFTRLYSWHISAPLDLAALHQAIPYFVGTHDFCSFANIRDSSKPETDTTRTIYRLDAITTSDGLALEFEGNGFLYKMVRNITGCLIEVGKKKRSADDIPALLSARNRTATGSAAPAHGLFLVDVLY